MEGSGSRFVAAVVVSFPFLRTTTTTSKNLTSAVFLKSKSKYSTADKDTAVMER